MPYDIVQIGSKFAVRTIDSGRLHGLTSKKSAERQRRLLEAVAHNPDFKKRRVMRGGAGTTVGTALSVVANPSQTVEEFKQFMKDVAGIWNNGDIAGGLRQKTPPITAFLIKYLPLGGAPGITAANALQRLNVPKWTNVIASLIDFVSGKGNIMDFFNSLKELVENLFDALKNVFQDIFVNKIGGPIAEGLMNTFNPAAMQQAKERAVGKYNELAKPREAQQRSDILHTVLSDQKDEVGHFIGWKDLARPNALDFFFDNLLQAQTTTKTNNTIWLADSCKLKLSDTAKSQYDAYIKEREAGDADPEHHPNSPTESYDRLEISEPVMRRMATIPWLLWMKANWATRPYALQSIPSFGPAQNWTEAQFVEEAKKLPPSGPNAETALKNGTDDSSFNKTFGPSSDIYKKMRESIQAHADAIAADANATKKKLADDAAAKKAADELAIAPNKAATADAADFKKRWNFNKKVIVPKQGPLHKAFFGEIGTTVEDWANMPNKKERGKQLFRFQMDSISDAAFDGIMNQAYDALAREKWQDPTQLPTNTTEPGWEDLNLSDVRDTMIDMGKPAANARNMSNLGVLATPKTSNGIAALEAPPSIFFQNATPSAVPPPTASSAAAAPAATAATPPPPVVAQPPGAPAMTGGRRTHVLSYAHIHGRGQKRRCSFDKDCFA